MNDIIKGQVRRNSSGELELFTRERAIGMQWLNSFSFSEGHNQCDEGYRLKCKPVPKDEAITFASRVRAYYNSEPMVSCNIVPVARLPFDCTVN